MSIENSWLGSHTTVYADPKKLANAGLLAVRQEQGGRRRKRVVLTARFATHSNAGGDQPR